MTDELMGGEKYTDARRRIEASLDDHEAAIIALHFYASATPYDLDFDGAGGEHSIARLTLHAMGEDY